MDLERAGKAAQASAALTLIAFVAVTVATLIAREVFTAFPAGVARGIQVASALAGLAIAACLARFALDVGPAIPKPAAWLGVVLLVAAAGASLVGALLSPGAVAEDGARIRPAAYLVSAAAGAWIAWAAWRGERAGLWTRPATVLGIIGGAGRLLQAPLAWDTTDAVLALADAGSWMTLGVPAWAWTAGGALRLAASRPAS